MFTFGIFTTHIPYIAMVAFYAYFLLFGVSQANEGKLRIAEKSQLVQMHIDNSSESTDADTYCFYKSFAHKSKAYFFEITAEKQKWKLYSESKTIPHDFCGNILFSRPPPALA